MPMREAVARWMVDDCPYTTGPHWDELSEDAKARWRLASVDLLSGPLAALTETARRVHAVRDLHAPLAIYEPCGHVHTDKQVARGVAVDTGEFYSCADGWLYSICSLCCVQPGGGQAETCCATHDHRKESPICPTMGLLEGRR